MSAPTAVFTDTEREIVAMLVKGRRTVRRRS